MGYYTILYIVNMGYYPKISHGSFAESTHHGGGHDGHLLRAKKAPVASGMICRLSSDTTAWLALA